MKEYHRLDEIQKDLYSRKITCLELVKAYSEQIEAKKHLNAFVEVYDKEALELAKKIDEKITSNEAGPLAGLIFGIKDLLCYQGHQVSGSSNILKGYESQITATAVQRMLDQDAIIIGRQNSDEFGMGSTNENSAWGLAEHPTHKDHVPGGSSGGSAAAVAAHLCHLSLGTDTGGSVRQPAAFCGVIGVKPSYSRISRWGLLAYASSFDTIGIITHSVEDAALVLKTIAGADQKDATCSTREVPDYTKALCQEKCSIAYYPEVLSSDGVQPAVKKQYAEIIEALKKQGHELIKRDFPFKDYILPTYYILTTAEASTNLSRYDGIHFGQRGSESEDLESLYISSRTEGFGAEVRRRILLGTFVLSADYYDAYFEQAQKVRQLIKAATEEILKKADFILTPTSPSTALKQSSHQTPLEMYMADLFTVQASIAGIPAFSIPTGKNDEGLAIGIQLMAGAFKEEKLFAFSKMVLDK